MSATRPAPLAKAELPTAQIAKAALRRLAAERLEPTPENYERAFRQEAGEAPEASDALAVLIERIMRGIEKGGQNWTTARRKEGIQRVLAAGRGDARKLQQRLAQLVNSWDGDPPATAIALASPVDAAASARASGAANATAAANSARPDDANPAWERVART